MVKRVSPHTLIEEHPLLGSDALIHVLHWETNVVREVTEGFFNIDHPPPCIGHKIEARVSFTTSFLPRICHEAPFLGFDGSITTFFNPFSFLLLIPSRLFPPYPVEVEDRGIRTQVKCGLVLYPHWGLSLLLELATELWWLFLLWAQWKIATPRQSRVPVKWPICAAETRSNWVNK